MSKKITLLGSTGSIGTQSLDVIRAQGYEVYGLSAHSHVEKLLPVSYTHLTCGVSLPTRSSSR